jgi:exopolyphosphatase / guanosine-5'-triphosphate,3'-diphosphate pyrophosphatase
MVVAEEQQGQIVMIDRIREMVRLASGLDENACLSKEVEKNALECLQRFGQRLRDMPSENVSAVGTNTLRRVENAELFLLRAEDALGHPIEIISGIEEARLIYQGVAHSLEPDHNNRLVIDIGGGSTELIIGEEFNIKMMESLEMGCVTMTQQFFPDGEITSKGIELARVNVLQKMKSIRHAFRHQGWDVVIGASGTIKSTASIIHEMALNNEDGITREGLIKLINKMKEFKTIDDIKLDGLSERRINVILGGVIVLFGVFEALSIEHMQVSDGALREGLLYDMLGRRQNKDIRTQSVQTLANRFHANVEHAQRIEDTACNLLVQVCGGWGMSLNDAQTLLVWACKVHEIGRDIAHSGYQKHSGYIVENTNLSGFSQQQQQRLATLIRVQRGKILNNNFDAINQLCKISIIKLAVILRLSVIFHRSRTATALPVIGVRVNENNIILSLPTDWLKEHPLTLNDLEQEAGFLKAVDMNLEVESVG